MNAKHAMLVAITAAVTAGCASTTTPDYDRHFGEAVRMARAQQTINPEASSNTDPVAGVDGPAAKEAMGRYQDSFKSPPPTFNVMNIGGAMSSSK
ncbi:MAG: hypothetical protein H6R10_976 [Rhodocyclaceae bacterium]|nr:hypothetical protein [Rhodocyclaceae bacterium]